MNDRDAREESDARMQVWEAALVKLNDVEEHLHRVLRAGDEISPGNPRLPFPESEDLLTVQGHLAELRGIVLSRYPRSDDPKS